jgi:hypothetical protein
MCIVYQARSRGARVVKLQRQSRTLRCCSKLFQSYLLCTVLAKPVSLARALAKGQRGKTHILQSQRSDHPPPPPTHTPPTRSIYTIIGACRLQLLLTAMHALSTTAARVQHFNKKKKRLLCRARNGRARLLGRPATAAVATTHSTGRTGVEH